MSAIHTITSREFGHNVSNAKHLAREGPVFITDRGTPAHVLLSFEEYQRLNGVSTRSLVDALAMSDGDDIEFHPPKADLILPVPDLEDEG